jgi:hypothetical protein
MRRPPPWGSTPELLPVPVTPDHIRAVEIRPVAPRHLLECYGAGIVRCTYADEFGYEHPGITTAIAALRRIARDVDALFAGTILEVIPVTDEVAVGRRVARAVVTDCYRFNDVDLRAQPYAERRTIVDALVVSDASTALRAAPLLRVQSIATPRADALSTSTRVQFIARDVAAESA